jgi:hypothetical protein
MLWYTREASVAVFVVNLPGIWPLLREHIRFLRNHTSYPSYPSRPSHLPQYGNISSSAPHSSSRARKNGGTIVEDEIELGASRASFAKSAGTRSVRSNIKGGGGDDERERERERIPRFGLGLRKGSGSPESDERVLTDGEGGGSGHGWGKGMHLEVQVDKTIEVQRGSWDNGEGRGGKERFQWEVETQAPKVRIQGPEGEIGRK